MTDRCPAVGEEAVDGLIDTPVDDISGSGPPEYACHSLDYLGAADRAHISDGEDRGESQFLQMDVLNLSVGVVRGRADLGNLTTRQCEEVSVSDNLCSLDSPTYVVANVGSDSSDIPPFAKPLVGDVKVDGSLVFDERLDGVDHMQVVTGLAGVHPMGKRTPWSALILGSPSTRCGRPGWSSLNRVMPMAR